MSGEIMRKRSVVYDVRHLDLPLATATLGNGRRSVKPAEVKVTISRAFHGDIWWHVLISGTRYSVKDDRDLGHDCIGFSQGQDDGLPAWARDLASKHWDEAAEIGPKP